MNAKFSIELLMNSGMLIVISFFIYVVAIAVSKLYTRLTRLNGQKKDVTEYVITFSNVGYMGYPVANALLGSEGVFYAAIYNLSFSLLIWTYGIHILSRSSTHEKLKLDMIGRMKRIVNPGLIAVIIGYSTFIFNYSLPGPILKTLDMIGSTTTPLSMMFIGFILTEVKIKEVIGDINLVLISLVRLLILPGIVYCIMKVAGFEGYLVSIPVLLTAMPAAANTAIFAARFGSDYRHGSLLIFVTTLLSIFTIPFVALFI